MTRLRRAGGDERGAARLRRCGWRRTRGGAAPAGGGSHGSSGASPWAHGVMLPEQGEGAAVVPVLATRLTREGREARLMRYQEKRKNRQFEKTIRYASRKAYAESWLRVKGRFAKRTNHDDDDAEPAVVPSSFMLDFGYGVVPTF